MVRTSTLTCVRLTEADSDSAGKTDKASASILSSLPVEQEHQSNPTLSWTNPSLIPLLNVNMNTIIAQLGAEPPTKNTFRSVGSDLPITLFFVRSCL